MRDWLATLLQVSYSSRECGNDLTGCLDKWTPLLTAVANKRGVSVSQLLNDTLLRSLQMMNDVESSNEELAAVELPSKNDEMGSSLIESKLDDHTLAHCFSFLDTKDVCTSIERTSHRFLQASRNRKQPFYEEAMDCSTLTRNSKPALSKPISLRWLRRFNIDCIKFDPHYANGSWHTLDLMDVVKAVGKSVKSCLVSFSADEYPNGSQWTIACEHLSNVTELIVVHANTRQLSEVCQCFPKCDTIQIKFPQSADLSPLNNLSHLRSLTMIICPNSAFYEELDERGGLGLKSDSFPELSELSMDCKLLPHLRPYLTNQIKSLELAMIKEWEWDFNCDLSGLKKIKLNDTSNPEQCRMMKSKSHFPKRIAELTLHLSWDWQVLIEWVDCVDLLNFKLNRRWASSDPLSTSQLDAILQRWRVKNCRFRLFEPMVVDLEIMAMIIGHERTQRTEFDIKVNWMEEFHTADVESALRKLKSAVGLHANCTLNQSLEL